MVTSSTAASGSIADQPVREIGGWLVERSGPGHAEMGETDPAPVLDGRERTGREHLQLGRAGTI